MILHFPDAAAAAAAAAETVLLDRIRFAVIRPCAEQ